MREMEHHVIFVLLRTLLDKNLITENLFEKAKDIVRDAWDDAVFFCDYEDHTKGEIHGHTPHSC